VDEYLDIGVETSLLSELRDFRDELKMLSTVLHQERQVLADFRAHLLEEVGGSKTIESVHIMSLGSHQMRAIETHVRDIERMDKQAADLLVSVRIP
jgi:predicted transposase YbfD/YdcC